VVLSTSFNRKGGDDWTEVNLDELEISVKQKGEVFTEHHVSRNHKNKNFWKHGPSCVGNRRYITEPDLTGPNTSLQRRVHTLTMDYIVQFMDNYDGMNAFGVHMYVLTQINFRCWTVCNRHLLSSEGTDNDENQIDGF